MKRKDQRERHRKPFFGPHTQRAWLEILGWMILLLIWAMNRDNTASRAYFAQFTDIQNVLISLFVLGPLVSGVLVLYIHFRSQ